MKEMRVIKVALDLEFKIPVVLLQEKEGNHKLPIWMELPEARTISLIMRNHTSSFPSTFDLVKKLIEKFKSNVDRVIINELKNDTYYAKILIRKDEEILEVDARPSDAIALALKFKAPIYLDEDKIQARKRPIDDLEIESFRKRLADIRPEDFLI